MASGWEEMTVVLVMLVISAGNPINGQTGTPGVFLVAKSCGSGNTVNPVVLSQLVVNGEMWLRSLHRITLQTQEGLQTHEGQDQSCTLSANVTFNILMPPRVRINSHLLVTNPRTGGNECQFPWDTVLWLDEGSALVSCRDGMEEAEREMNGLPESDPTTQPSLNTTTQPFFEPKVRSLNLIASENTTHLFKAATETPVTTTEIVNSDTDVAFTEQTTTTNSILTIKPVQDANNAKMQSSDTTLDTVSVTGISLTSLDTESGTDIAENFTAAAEVMHEPPTTTPKAPTTGKAGTIATLPHLQNIQAPSPADEDHMKHSFPYFIGAGACIVVLIIGIIIVVCVTKHKSTKPKTCDNHEEFFIGGTQNGSLNRLKPFESDESKQRYNGSFNNANIMYSDNKVEYVESFEIEEKILKSETSASEPEVPKCLR